VGVVAGLLIIDDDGNETALDANEARNLLALTDGLEAATVSACPACGSRVLASVAFVDLLDAAPPFARGSELVEFACEAPTLHLYVVDRASDCEHPQWRDPLFDEWCEVVEAPGFHTRR
jgi:hypothetical protein